MPSRNGRVEAHQSHGIELHDVVDRFFGRAVGEVEARPQLGPVVVITGDREQRSGEWCEQLGEPVVLLGTAVVDQVTGRVRWRESVLAMQESGVERFVELGGKVLGPMVGRIAKEATTVSLVTMEDLENFAKENG